MFYDKERLFNMFQFQYKDRCLPDEVLHKLAEYTNEKHFAIKYSEVGSILFLGTFENEDTVKEKIEATKYQSRLYDHYYTEFKGVYYLFDFWFRPFD